MKTKSVILGTGFDVFIVRYFLENFKTWQDKIDMLYLCLDGPHCKEVENYLGREIAKLPKVKVLRNLGDFPHNLKKAILETNEELILSLHDDTYIYNPDILDKYFEIADEGKIVMPVQSLFNPTEETKEVIKKHYPFMPWKAGDEDSYTFIMYFTFCSRKNYLKTNLDFKCDAERPGFYIKELDYTIKDNWGGDVGFWQGLQFLHNNIEVMPIKSLTSAYVPHNATPVTEFNRIVDEKPDWLHLQNISRTIPLWFLTEEEWYLGKGDKKEHKIHHLEPLKGNTAVLEDMALKIAWLKEYMAVDEYAEIKDFYNYVKGELEYIIDYMGIDRAKIEKYLKIIKRLEKK